jgi:hypothetical protein
MIIRVLIISVVLTGFLLQACTKEETRTAKDNLVGRWVVDSATVEEIIDDQFDFRKTRVLQSVEIDFYRDNVYKAREDSANALWFFTVEGQDGASNQIEGGVWQAEENFTKIRLDRNVPEFRGELPVVFNIKKLSENEMIIEHEVDPWELKDSSRIDLSARNFMLPKGWEDGLNIYNITPVPDSIAGYRFGKNTGYNIGFYTTEKIKVFTARRTYYLAAREKFIKNRLNRDIRYQKFDAGFMKGDKEGIQEGLNDGLNSRLASLKRISKFTYYAHKQGNL